LPTRINAATRQASVTLAAQMPGTSQMFHAVLSGSPHHTCLFPTLKSAFLRVSQLFYKYKRLIINQSVPTFAYGFFATI